MDSQVNRRRGREKERERGECSPLDSETPRETDRESRDETESLLFLRDTSLFRFSSDRVPCSFYPVETRGEIREELIGQKKNAQVR